MPRPQQNWVRNCQFNVVSVRDCLCGCYLADAHSELSVETNNTSDQVKPQMYGVGLFCDMQTWCYFPACDACLIRDYASSNQRTVFRTFFLISLRSSICGIRVGWRGPRISSAYSLQRPSLSPLPTSEQLRCGHVADGDGQAMPGFQCQHFK